MNSENSWIFKPSVLILKLTDRLDLISGEKVLLYQILLFTTHGKTEKAHATIITLKYQLQHGMMNLNYLMDDVLYVL